MQCEYISFAFPDRHQTGQRLKAAPHRQQIQTAGALAAALLPGKHSIWRPVWACARSRCVRPEAPTKAPRPSSTHAAYSSPRWRLAPLSGLLNLMVPASLLAWSMQETYN